MNNILYAAGVRYTVQGPVGFVASIGSPLTHVWTILGEFNGPVQALTLYQSKLVAGGRFTQA